MDRLDQVEKTAATTTRELTHVRERLDRAERQLGALLAARTDQRNDLVGVEHGRHQDIARRARALIEQRFLNLARRYADASAHTMDRPERERAPYLISLLCRQLLTDHPLSSAAICRELRLPDHGGHTEQAIASLRSDCSLLVNRIHQAGLEHRWDFRLTSRSRLESPRQEAWPTCDPHDPALFVVSPAYVVKDIVYCPQYVYTSRSLHRAH
ncbi:hypothetical protein ACIQVR_31600 [Streptomyces xanthochromogenes]|uniref:hypothetical protein n=1 Tax=Streptomyces xanthochromogenes TaxID=67384 RepID=UPI00381D9651